MGLKTISPGEEADAVVLMDNFTYLNGQINTTNSTVSSMQSTVQTTINNTLSIYQDVATLSSSGTIVLSSNTVNKISASGNVIFSLPTVSDTTKFNQILIQLYMPSAVTINLGTTYFFNAASPDMSATGYYDIIYEYDTSDSHWYCGVIYKGAVS